MKLYQYLAQHGEPEEIQHAFEALISGYVESQEKIQKIEKALYGIIEYFDAIESGEYPMTRPELRPMEDVLRARAKKALGNAK